MLPPGAKPLTHVLYYKVTSNGHACNDELCSLVLNTSLRVCLVRVASYSLLSGGRGGIIGHQSSRFPLLKLFFAPPRLGSRRYYTQRGVPAAGARQCVVGSVSCQQQGAG